MPTKEELFDMIRRNGHKKIKAIHYIADFLVISYKEAKEIYEEEFEKNEQLQKSVSDD